MYCMTMNKNPAAMLDSFKNILYYYLLFIYFIATILFLGVLLWMINVLLFFSFHTMW